MAARKKAATNKTRKASTGRRCGLCGKTGDLVRAECCGNWTCDDEGKYVLFSYARTSCARNHSRFTLCGFHHAEGHSGTWQACPACRNEFETEIYVFYGTNEYNFTKLENPPAFEPTKCCDCGKVIHLGLGGYSAQGAKYWCDECSRKSLSRG